MSIKGSVTSAASRLHNKYTVNPVTNCWEWHGSFSGQGHYPTISLAGGLKPEYAHRIAWAEVNGPIPLTPCPDGSWRWELHHRCFNNNCVNPSHIKLVTQKKHAAIHAASRAATKLAKAA
jgi:hypothetical protein